MRITRLHNRPEELINIELVITATPKEITDLKSIIKNTIETNFEDLDLNTESEITNFLALIKDQLD